MSSPIPGGTKPLVKQRLEERSIRDRTALFILGTHRQQDRTIHRMCVAGRVLATEFVAQAACRRFCAASQDVRGWRKATQGYGFALSVDAIIMQRADEKPNSSDEGCAR